MTEATHSSEIDLLERMLVMSPGQRATAGELLDHCPGFYEDGDLTNGVEDWLHFPDRCGSPLTLLFRRPFVLLLVVLGCPTD